MNNLTSVLCILFLFVLTFAEKKDTLFQPSFQHGKTGIDTILLMSNENDEPGYFSSVKILRNSKLIYSIHDSLLEFVPFDKNVFKEISIGKGVFIYIFRINDRPLPDRFLVVESTPDSINQLGITPNTTAIIFGDIDRDGKIEMGGYNDYESSEFTAFKLTKGYPTDTVLSNAINTLIKAKDKNNKKK